jgi:hypothetical protein
VDPDDAHRRILEELAKGEYRQGDGFIPWVLGLIQAWLDALLGQADGGGPVRLVILVLVALLLVLLVVLLLRRTGWVRRTRGLDVSTALDAEPELSAVRLRMLSRSALSDGRKEATVLAVRALVRDLSERTLLEVTDSVTAHEAAIGAAVFFPDVHVRLERAAADFDTAAYSRHRVGQRRAEDVLRLVEFVAGSSPQLADRNDTGTTQEEATPV